MHLILVNDSTHLYRLILASLYLSYLLLLDASAAELHRRRQQEAYRRRKKFGAGHPKIKDAAVLFSARSGASENSRSCYLVTAAYVACQR